MIYLVNRDISEEIHEPETDPLTGNFIGAAIHVHRASSNKDIITPVCGLCGLCGSFLC